METSTGEGTPQLPSHSYMLVMHISKHGQAQRQQRLTRSLSNTRDSGNPLELKQRQLP